MDDVMVTLAPNHEALCGALLNLKGAIHLSAAAINAHMDLNPELVAAEGVLQLAAAEIERLYAIMNLGAVRSRWPVSGTEAAHG